MKRRFAIAIFLTALAVASGCGTYGKARNQIPWRSVQVEVQNSTGVVINVTNMPEGGGSITLPWGAVTSAASAVTSGMLSVSQTHANGFPQSASMTAPKMSASGIVLEPVIVPLTAAPPEKRIGD